MTPERHSNIRLIAVFLMGLSVGISVMLIYNIYRAPNANGQSPAAEVEGK